MDAKVIKHIADRLEMWIKDDPYPEDVEAFKQLAGVAFDSGFTDLSDELSFKGSQLEALAIADWQDSQSEYDARYD